MADELTAVEELHADAAPTLELSTPHLEKELRQSLDTSGFLSDAAECTVDSLASPAAVAPWKSFANLKIYRSAAATTALRSLLRCAAPGTSTSFEAILSAVARPAADGTQQSYCYLVGGQVRDVLRGTLSTDIDFNYSCSAMDVALVTVANKWPTKYKCIGPTETPNYVLIGDEGSETYLEGFCIDFNATRACCTNDLTMNTLLYDLANDVILDKTGQGVSDIRERALRVPLGENETLDMWSAAHLTPGSEELRYLKFWLRAEAEGTPYAHDPAECAFVVASLRRVLESNADALRGFWLGYTLKADRKSVV